MFVSVDRAKAIEHAPGLFSAKLIDGSRGAERLSLLHGWLMPGAQHALHTHETEEVVYVISGRGIIEIDGRRIPVRAGDAMRFPPNVPHSTVNTHPTDNLVFVAAFSDQIIDARSCATSSPQGMREGRLAPIVNRARWLARRIVRRMTAAYH